MKDILVNPEIERLLEKERFRQNSTINLIASENFASDAVVELSGSLFTNKYAEGYPSARYYNGCEHYDEIENMAIKYAKQIFQCGYANVQPHSGANANLAVMNAFLKPGDTILTMSLSDGGHLSHGSPVNISGKLYNVVNYGVDAGGNLDYVEIEKLAIKHEPKMIVAGASAYSKQIDWHMFKNIANKVNAYFLADMAHYSGLIAAGVYDTPVDWADFVTSTTHKTLRGPRGGLILWNNDKYSKKINSSVFPGIQGGPLMNQIAAKAQCFWEASQPYFYEYAKAVKLNAYVMCETFKKEGYDVVSGGTQSHMFILDLTSKNISGKVVADELEKNGIVVNKNSIPNDTRGPRETSGIRIGVAAETTRVGSRSDWFSDLAYKIIDIIEEKI